MYVLLLYVNKSCIIVAKGVKKNVVQSSSLESCLIKCKIEKEGGQNRVYVLINLNERVYL